MNRKVEEQYQAPGSDGGRAIIPGWDALLLAGLVLASLRINSLAEASVLPTLRQDVLRHPFLGSLLPDAGLAAMGERGPSPGEPVGLVLIALSLLFVALYLMVDLTKVGRWHLRLKWGLLILILFSVIVLPTIKLTLLRAQSGPASYTHDGGVIQTEAATEYLLSGRNPYVEDYTQTPMAEWGFDEFRTALYHFPYLPWTFLFSAPFYLMGQWLGFYDQRIVYLALYGVMLLAAAGLVAGSRNKLALVMLLGLNPLMGLDVIFGQNDSFVLAWMAFALVAWRAWWLSYRRGEEREWLRVLAAAFYGLACASKPTAWFMAPFFGLLLVADLDVVHQGWSGMFRAVPRIVRRALPAVIVFALLLGPYLVWDAYALYDDVWRWSSGRGETGYQIWGWGGSNFVLALGLVEDRFDEWPFWLPELVVTLPLLLWFLRRQQRDNRLGMACWHYGLLLFCFFYVSRFFNENYLGYILAFLAAGYVLNESDISRDGQPGHR